MEASAPGLRAGAVGTCGKRRRCVSVATFVCGFRRIVPPAPRLSRISCCTLPHGIVHDELSVRSHPGDRHVLV